MSANALYAELDALIGQRKGWVLFYRSQYGLGWAKRDGDVIRLRHESTYGVGGCTEATVKSGALAARGGRG